MRKGLATSARFLRRQWQRRLAAWRPTLVATAVLGAIAFAGWVVFFSSWLAADEVQVAGTRTVSAKRVIAAADIRTGTPLVRVDLDAVNRKVAAIPAVASVATHRSWPHTLTITVTERTPVATVHRQGGWWVLDVEGTVYRKDRERDPALAVVEYRGDDDRVALREVAAVVTTLPGEIRAQTQRITASSMDSISLRLRDGRRVVWGSSAESERKVQVLLLLLRRPFAVYDVSVPGQPTTSGRRPRD
ncbi:MAG: FtsQ-type POTRA domain-containing protein [Actinomycetota bacterium]|nr:FtsQ-type POTRA domain-containing protein [Actinomycetota bacterium]